MNPPKPVLPALFEKTVLKHPLLTMLVILSGIAFLGFQALNFRLDASSETLILDNDTDYLYARIVSERYGTSDYLLITYAPKEDLFSDGSLAKLKQLRDELKARSNVTGVVTILDVPLLESPPVPVKELIENIRTLESPDVDKELAKVEFKNSPLYQNLLISPDLKITGLQINFAPDPNYEQLEAKRNSLRDKQKKSGLTSREKEKLKEAEKVFQLYRDGVKKRRHQDIVEIRKIMDQYRDHADLFLGGVSMIADDLISFIKNDLKLFGLGVLLFLICTLRFIFRQIRWVVIPILCCGFSAIAMMGFLGMFGWEVTVISSNFISLQLIITMAIAIHLIVRYRELDKENPHATQEELIRDTVFLMARPCLYAGLTTIAGFGSLLLCDILPVRTFGWMMIAGILVSLVITFLLFPALLIILGKKGLTPKKGNGSGGAVPAYLAGLTEKRGTTILVISLALSIFSILGLLRLEVENAFIDYFKSSTEIYQGMTVIDQNLGGTTPLDIIVEFGTEAEEIVTGREEASEIEDEDGFDEFDDEFDEFDDEFDEFQTPQDKEAYWFTVGKMALVEKVHDYLDTRPETGKVLSLGTMIKVARTINNGKDLDNFQLALLYRELPNRFRNLVLNPYVSVENNQVRFSVRVRDSEKTLKRDRFLKTIANDFKQMPELKTMTVRLAGMLVLYNNMLQSLFASQIKTLGFVVLALMVMFMILFRSIKIALIAIFPNLLATGAVLGFMGWLTIPLDMMTITIAAISVGIAVDDTIHYIHRFIHEFQKEPDYMKTMHKCHNSIGHAMYFTSITIIIGFSILVLSNFIPSIYFGVLTGLAMFIALIASLTLLPQLMIVFKPLGPEA